MYFYYLRSLYTAFSKVPKDIKEMKVEEVESFNCVGGQVTVDGRIDKYIKKKIASQEATV